MDDLLLYNSAEVADRIDKILSEKKIIKKIMLKELGLSINTTSNMRNGRALASDSLARIADYVGVTTDFLLGRTDDPAPLDTISKIKLLLNEKGWSVSQLCRQMGVARTFINDIQKTGRQIPEDRLNQIASILDVSVDYLLGRTQQKKPALNEDELDEQEREILTLLRGVPEDKRAETERAVMALIAGLTNRK